MKTNKTRHSIKGFTLIEIMGALLVIGIIAAIAIPTIQAVRKSSAIVNVTKQVDTVRAAVSALVQKPGGNAYPPITDGASATTAYPSSTIAGTPTAGALNAAATLDNVLLTERLLETPLNIKLGSGANTPTGTVELVWVPASNAWSSTAAPTRDYSTISRAECAIAVPATTPSAANGANFYLGRDTTAIAAGSRVVYLVIPQILGTDAKALADTLNNNSAASATAACDQGLVAYAAPTAATGLTTAYVYVTSF